MTILTRQQFLAILLAALMVAGAGCAGWGTDGPAETETDNNTTNAPENASTNATNSTDTPNASEEAHNDPESGDSGEADSEDTDTTSPDESDDSASSDSSTESSDSASAESDSPEESSASTGSDSDEEDTSSDSGSSTDSDSDSDSGSDTSDSPPENPDENPDEDEDEDEEPDPEPAESNTTLGNETDESDEDELYELTIGVVDMETGEPIENAAVIVTEAGGPERDARTDASGTAVVEVPNGEHMIRVAAYPDYDPPQYAAIVIDGSDEEITLPLAPANEEEEPPAEDQNSTVFATPA